MGVISQRTTLNSICEFIIDCEHKTAPLQEEGYPSIRTPNIGRGRLILEGVNRVSEDIYRQWTQRAVPRTGDLILAREAPVGNVAIIPKNLRVCLGQRTVLIRPDKSKVDGNYLVYLLLGDEVQGKIHSLTAGATVAHLNMGEIRKMELPLLPPLPTQRKIAAILSAYDDLIENNTRRIKILEEMAQAIYREWFVHFRFPGYEGVRMVESELGLIPEGWGVRKLGEVIELLYGKGLKTEERKEGDIPVFGSSGIVGYHNQALVKGPGIIIGRKGNVGSVYWSDIDFFPIDTVYYAKSLLPFYYLFYNLKRQNFINNDAAVPGLNRNQAYSLPIIIPDSQSLKKFENILRNFFVSMKIISNKNINLRKTRDLLLPKLISGELDVSELDIMIPEAMT